MVSGLETPPTRRPILKLTPTEDAQSNRLCYKGGNLGNYFRINILRVALKSPAVRV